MALALLKNLGGTWIESRWHLANDLTRVEGTFNQYVVVNDQKWTDLYKTLNPVYNWGTVSPRPTLDWDRGPFQRVKLSANTTFAFVNPVDGITYTLLIDTGAGAFTGTWPTTVRWAGSAAPTITVAANKVDIVTLRWVKSLNTYFSSISQNY